jgi:hypothetical protein
MQYFTFLIAATVVSATKLPTCGCHAEALGFKIDCEKTAVIQTAYDYCAKNCLTKCDSDDCKKNFAIVESHHDFCLHDQVPKEVEVGFHDLEEVCKPVCVIGRLQDPDHIECPTMECPNFFGTEAVIKTLTDNSCDTACPEATCGEAFRKLRVIHDLCPNAEDKGFEWSGVFPMADASHTWSMQKVDGAYADPSMRLGLIPTSTPTAVKMEEMENKGSNLLAEADCTVVQAGGSMKPAADGSCFELTVGSGDDSTFTIDTSGITGLLVYAQHVPIEFERDTHYLYDSSNVDIEPIAQSTMAWEWGGVFAVSGATHTWSMQKVGGAYADPSMDLVIIPTATPTEATMEALKYDGSDMLGGTCTVVNDGGSMTPATGGSCFKLTVDASKDDSTFTINTAGITGIAVYAQHVPTEFERDAHYLYTGSGASKVDIEPVAQEASGGGGHSHGHRRLARRLADVDAALHTYEDMCDPVACYVKATGCSAGAPDLTKLDDLQDRAGKRCFIKADEATTCPTSTDDTESGAKHGAVLAGVALLLTAAMQ